MPPLPSVPNVVKVTHKFTLGADTAAETRWHMSYTGGPPSNADCATLATAINAAAVTHLVPLLGSDNIFAGIEVLDLSSPSGGAGEDLTVTGGSRGGGGLAAGTAVLSSLPIPRRYRGGKPRTYWPFLTSGDVSSPTAWEGSAVTDVLTGLEAYLGEIEVLTAGTTDLHQLVSVSYYAGFTSVLNPITGRTKDVAKLRVGGPVVDIVSSIIVAPGPKSQRRRNL